ncbi:MAG: sulfotransferase [Promethearchaeota archaeon]
MKRTKEFRRNKCLEDLIKEINTYFSEIERLRICEFDMPKYPVVFVVGSPRSGTTLLTQYLAGTGDFGYPSNLIARFYLAPYWGIKIQDLLFNQKYNFNNELFDFNKITSFESMLGKTRGLLEPNEFWYFWRRFFKPSKINNKISSKSLKFVNKSMLCKELAAMEYAFGKPLLFKGMMMNWNLDYLYEILKNKVIFIFIKRELSFNVQSLLKARMLFWGNINKWYSFKPPEYKILRKYEPIKQIVGQIYYTNKFIISQLKKMPKRNYIELKYEFFCKDSDYVLKRLNECFKAHNINFLIKSKNKKKFNVTNKILVSEKEWKRIEEAIEFIEDLDKEIT